MLRRKVTTERKTPVKGVPEKKVQETVCSSCGKKRQYSNKSKKLCAVCVKKIQTTKAKEKKAKVREKKRLSISALTKKLDQIYSVYIRLVYTTADGMCKCFTCDQKLHWRRIQNGHFQSRRFMSTRFHEHNCAPQCYACNIGLSGNQYIYGVKLDEKFGPGTAQSMVTLSRQITKFTAEDLLRLIDETEDKVERLRKSKNIWD